MSSTITTTTVAILSSAGGIGELATTFTMISVVLLGLVLLGKEITAEGRHPRMRGLARGLDIATAPLIVAFAMTLALRLADSF